MSRDVIVIAADSAGGGPAREWYSRLGLSDPGRGGYRAVRDWLDRYSSGVRPVVCKRTSFSLWSVRPLHGHERRAGEESGLNFFPPPQARDIDAGVITAALAFDFSVLTGFDVIELTPHGRDGARASRPPRFPDNAVHYRGRGAAVPPGHVSSC